MGCVLRSAIPETEPGYSMQDVTCDPACTGPERKPDGERPIFFGRLGPMIKRTVTVCPLDGYKRPTGLMADIFFEQE